MLQEWLVWLYSLPCRWCSPWFSCVVQSWKPINIHMSENYFWLSLLDKTRAKWLAMYRRTLVMCYIKEHYNTLDKLNKIQIYACIVFKWSEFECDLLECSWIISLFFFFPTGCRTDVLPESSVSFLTYCISRTSEAQHEHHHSYRIFQLLFTRMGDFSEEILSLFHHHIWHRTDLSPN